MCIAGVRLDTPTPQWCRRVSVDFRGLPESRRFHKYDVVRCQAGRPAKRHAGPRASARCSTRSRSSTPTPGGRPPRWPLIEPLLSQPRCARLYDLEREQGTSLGLFKPGEILDFHIEGAEDEWDERSHAILNQQSLLPALAKRRPLEKLPYTFGFSTAAGTRPARTATSSRSSTGRLRDYRKTTVLHGGEAARARARTLAGARLRNTRDTYFYAGNHSRHPHTLILLGAFWPPRSVARPEELVLF